MIIVLSAGKGSILQDFKLKIMNLLKRDPNMSYDKKEEISKEWHVIPYS